MNSTYAGIGSRKTPEDIITLMHRLGVRLAELGFTLHSGAANGADTAFEIGIKTKAVTHQSSLIPTSLPTSSVPGFVASLQTIADKDPACLRTVSLGVDGAEVSAIEDQSLDSLKLEHRAETVAYMYHIPVTETDTDLDGVIDFVDQDDDTKSTERSIWHLHYFRPLINIMFVL